MGSSSLFHSTARPWLARAVGRCAPLPPPILRVLSTIADGECDLALIRAALDATEGLRDKLLAIANSAYYAPAVPIVDVAHAASLVGQRMLLSMTMAYGLRSYFDLGSACHGHSRHGLLVHGLGAATTAWALADEFGLPPAEGARLYTAGLFHDVGKTLVAERARTTHTEPDLAATPDEPPGLVHLEHERLGIDHAEASALLAGRWQLDAEVRDLIAGHHEPPAGDLRGAILHLADHLSARHGVGFRDGLPPETPLAPQAIAVFAHRPDAFAIAGQHALQETARAIATIERLL